MPRAQKKNWKDRQVNKKEGPPRRVFLYANNLGVREQANKSIKRSSIRYFLKAGVWYTMTRAKNQKKIVSNPAFVVFHTSTAIAKFFFPHPNQTNETSQCPLSSFLLSTLYFTPQIRKYICRIYNKVHAIFLMPRQWGR